MFHGSSESGKGTGEGKDKGYPGAHYNNAAASVASRSSLASPAMQPEGLEPHTRPQSPQIMIVDFDRLNNSANGGGGNNELEQDEEEEGEEDDPAARINQFNPKLMNKVAQMFKQFQIEDDPNQASHIKVRDELEGKDLKPRKEDYGLNVKTLKKWAADETQRRLEDESARQDMAVLKVRNLLSAIAKVTKVQTWWRMIVLRNKFLVYREGRKAVKRIYYVGWKRLWKADKLFKNQVLGKPFCAWRDEIRDSKRLDVIVKHFFALCIKRLKLTPQAVMAFNTPSVRLQIAEEDLIKIRRLILTKLFKGWYVEMRTSKANQFKASQMLARMMRRSMGPMWAKEITLVTFHMWFRYSAVKNALRRGDPEPRFTSPHLPQWYRLVNRMTLERVKKMRTRERGLILALRRNFRRWLYAMTLDRSMRLSPWEQAVQHYNRKLTSKVVHAWHMVLRARGRIRRIRDKIFEAWKHWAPKKRRLRNAKVRAQKWARCVIMRHAVDAMKLLCYDVIAKRTEALKIMRRNPMDRRVLSCAYALQHMDTHVVMLDCWRRWSTYARYRHQWKTALWRTTYEWYLSRNKAVFAAWKSYIRDRKAAKLERQESDSQLDGNINENNEPSQFFSASLAIPTDDGDILLAGRRRVVVEEEVSLPHVEYPALFPDVFAEQFAIILQCARCITGGNNDSIPPNSDTSSVATMAAAAMFTDQHLPSSPHAAAFYMVCLTWTLHYSQTRQSRKDNETCKSLQTAVDHAKLVETAEILSRTLGYNAKTIELLEAANEGGKKKKKAGNTSNSNSNGNNSINPLSAPSFRAGALVDPVLVEQTSRGIGNHYFLLCCTLLSAGVFYLARRVTRGDKNDALLQCQNPMTAVLLSTQIDRWERGDLSRRELVPLMDRCVLRETSASAYQSVVLWRAIVAMAVRKTGDGLRAGLVTLPDSRSVDEEVAEVIRRQRVARIRDVHKSLLTMHVNSSLIGEEAQQDTVQADPIVVTAAVVSDNDHSSSNDQINGINGIESNAGGSITSVADNANTHTGLVTGNNYSPSQSSPLPLPWHRSFLAQADSYWSAEHIPLLVDHSTSSKHVAFAGALRVFVRGTQPVTDGERKAREKALRDSDNMLMLDTNINIVLREYTEIFLQMSRDARALQVPYQARDDALYKNGFMRQAREDFLVLRKSCLSTSQLVKMEAKEAAARVKARREERLRLNAIAMDHFEPLQPSQIQAKARNIKGIDENDENDGNQIKKGKTTSTSDAVANNANKTKDRDRDKNKGKVKDANNAIDGNPSLELGDAENPDPDENEVENDNDNEEGDDEGDDGHGRHRIAMSSADELDVAAENDFLSRSALFENLLLEVQVDDVVPANLAESTNNSSSPAQVPAMDNSAPSQELSTSDALRAIEVFAQRTRRRLRNAKAVLKRVATFIANGGVLGFNLLLDNLSHIDGGPGAWLVAHYHRNHTTVNTNTSYADTSTNMNTNTNTSTYHYDLSDVTPVWRWLPPQFWDIDGLLSRFYRESATIEALTGALTEQMAVYRKDKSRTHARRRKLHSVTADAQAELVAIAAKKKQLVGQNRNDRQARLRPVYAVDREANKLGARLALLREQLSRSEVMLAAGNMFEVFASFEVGTVNEVTVLDELGSVCYGHSIKAFERELVRTAKELLGPEEVAAAVSKWKEDLIKTRTAELASMTPEQLRHEAFKVIDQKKAMLPQFAAEAAALDTRRKAALLEVRSLDDTCARVDAWMRQLAETKFNIFVDVQALAGRIGSEQKDIQRSEASLATLVNGFDSYTVGLGAYHNYLVRQKEAMVQAKLREDYEALMGAGAGSSSARSPGRNRHKTPNNNLDNGIANAGFAQSSQIATATSGSCSTVNIGKQGNNSSNVGKRKEAVNNGTFANTSSALKTQQQSQVAFGKHVGKRVGGSKDKDRDKDKDKDAADIPEVTSRLSRMRLEQENARRLMEEEAEAAAAAVQEAHELRMKVFDEYWQSIGAAGPGLHISQSSMSMSMSQSLSQSLPEGVTLAVDINTGEVENGDEDHSIYSHDTDSLAGMGRTTRMWTLLADTHWREKDAKVRAKMGYYLPTITNEDDYADRDPEERLDRDDSQPRSPQSRAANKTLMTGPSSPSSELLKHNLAAVAELNANGRLGLTSSQDKADTTVVIQSDPDIDLNQVWSSKVNAHGEQIKMSVSFKGEDHPVLVEKRQRATSQRTKQPDPFCVIGTEAFQTLRANNNNRDISRQGSPAARMRTPVSAPVLAPSSDSNGSSLPIQIQVQSPVQTPPLVELALVPTSMHVLHEVSLPAADHPSDLHVDLDSARSAPHAEIYILADDPDHRDDNDDDENVDRPPTEREERHPMLKPVSVDSVDPDDGSLSSLMDRIAAMGPPMVAPTDPRDLFADDLSVSDEPEAMSTQEQQPDQNLEMSETKAISEPQIDTPIEIDRKDSFKSVSSSISNVSGALANYKDDGVGNNVAVVTESLAMDIRFAMIPHAPSQVTAQSELPISEGDRQQQPTSTDRPDLKPFPIDASVAAGTASSIPLTVLAMIVDGKDREDRHYSDLDDNEDEDDLDVASGGSGASYPTAISRIQVVPSVHIGASPNGGINSNQVMAITSSRANQLTRDRDDANQQRQARLGATMMRNGRQQLQVQVGEFDEGGVLEMPAVRSPVSRPNSRQQRSPSRTSRLADAEDVSDGVAVMMNGQWSVQRPVSPAASPAGLPSPLLKVPSHSQLLPSQQAQSPTDDVIAGIRVDAIGLRPPLLPSNSSTALSDPLGSIGERDLLHGSYLQRQQYSRGMFEGSLVAVDNDDLLDVDVEESLVDIVKHGLQEIVQMNDNDIALLLAETSAYATEDEAEEEHELVGKMANGSYGDDQQSFASPNQKLQRLPTSTLSLIAENVWSAMVEQEGVNPSETMSKMNRKTLGKALKATARRHPWYNPLRDVQYSRPTPIQNAVVRRLSISNRDAGATDFRDIDDSDRNDDNDHDAFAADLKRAFPPSSRAVTASQQQLQLQQQQLTSLSQLSLESPFPAEPIPSKQGTRRRRFMRARTRMLDGSSKTEQLEARQRALIGTGHEQSAGVVSRRFDLPGASNGAFGKASKLPTSTSINNLLNADVGSSHNYPMSLYSSMEVSGSTLPIQSQTQMQAGQVRRGDGSQLPMHLRKGTNRHQWSTLQTTSLSTSSLASAGTSSSASYRDAMQLAQSLLAATSIKTQNQFNIKSNINDNGSDVIGEKNTTVGSTQVPSMENDDEDASVKIAYAALLGYRGVPSKLSQAQSQYHQSGHLYLDRTSIDAQAASSVDSARSGSESDYYHHNHGHSHGSVGSAHSPVTSASVRSVSRGVDVGTGSSPGLGNPRDTAADDGNDDITLYSDDDDLGNEEGLEGPTHGHRNHDTPSINSHKSQLQQDYDESVFSKLEVSPLSPAREPPLRNGHREWMGHSQPLWMDPASESAMEDELRAMVFGNKKTNGNSKQSQKPLGNSRSSLQLPPLAEADNVSNSSHGNGNGNTHKRKQSSVLPLPRQRTLLKSLTTSDLHANSGSGGLNGGRSLDLSQGFLAGVKIKQKNLKKKIFPSSAVETGVLSGLPQSSQRLHTVPSAVSTADGSIRSRRDKTPLTPLLTSVDLGESSPELPLALSSRLNSPDIGNRR